MSEVDPVDDQTKVKNPGGKDDDKKDSVSYDSHKKLLDEKKKVADENKALKERLEAIENEKLQASGKDKELAEKLRKELEEERSRAKQSQERIVKDRVENTLKSAAEKAGLTMPFEKFAKLVDLSTVDVNADTLEVNAKDIERVLEKAREDMPYLFGKTKVDVNNVNPNEKSKSESGSTIKDLSKKSVDELKGLLKNHY